MTQTEMAAAPEYAPIMGVKGLMGSELSKCPRGATEVPSHVNLTAPCPFMPTAIIFTRLENETPEREAENSNKVGNNRRHHFRRGGEKNQRLGEVGGGRRT